MAKSPANPATSSATLSATAFEAGTTGARLTRRSALCAAAAVAAINVALPAQASGLPPITHSSAHRCHDTHEWAAFKHSFLHPEGRIVDNGNGGVSHTEGQGWGMLFAVAQNDIDTFDRLLAWTRSNMMRPDDTLHAWRYVPYYDNKVPDRNNATDGDIFIAAAMARAADRWNRDDLRSAATAMAKDILKLLVRQVGTRTVLLPGAAGFYEDGAAIVNPSYYAFPLLAELARLAPSPVWDDLQRDGLALVTEGRFGPWSLPPDWLHVAANGTLSPSSHHPTRFSYDAIRVPLWLAWAKAPTSALRDFDAFWTANAAAQPAWIDVVTDQRAPWSAPSGMIAVAHMSTAAFQKAPLKHLPHVVEAPDYYSAALILLSRLAWRETSNA